MIWSAWVLVAWLLALRWLSGLPDDGCPWRSRVDVPLALGSGVVFAALTGLWFPAEHMAAWNLTASDFSQYCESVAAVQVGAYDKVHVQRSLFAARQLLIQTGFAALQNQVTLYKTLGGGWKR